VHYKLRSSNRSSEVALGPINPVVRAALAFALFAVSARPLIAQFLETHSVATVLSNPYSIASGDFNGDGKLDLAVTAFYNGQVAVLIGNGDGTFKSAAYYSVGGNETADSIVAADLRGAGLLDLVVTDSLDANVRVLLGNGDGTFGTATPHATVGDPFHIAVGDFTGDGIPDIAAQTTGSAKGDFLEVLPGRGDGTFGSPILTKMDFSVGIVAGQFSSGPNLDIASAADNMDSLEIYLGNGDGTFRLGENYPCGSPPESFVTASFRKNGVLDLAAGLPFGSGVAIFLGNGDGTFTQGETVPGGFASGVTAGDMNGDGIPDLVFVTGPQSSTLEVYLGNGDGTFRPGSSTALGFDGVGPAIGDLNGDRQNDVIVSNYNANLVVALLNTGVVEFSPATPLNFKKQEVGSTSTPRKVTLTNTGKTGLKISSMKVTGQFGITSTCGKGLEPGASCAIDVTFSPQTHGPQTGAVTIDDSASSKPQVIELSGTGTT